MTPALLRYVIACQWALAFYPHRRRLSAKSGTALCRSASTLSTHH